MEIDKERMKEILNNEIDSDGMINNEIKAIMNKEMINKEIINKEIINKEIINNEEKSDKIMNSGSINSEVINNESINEKMIYNDVMIKKLMENLNILDENDDDIINVYIRKMELDVYWKGEKTLSKLNEVRQYLLPKISKNIKNICQKVIHTNDSVLWPTYQISILQDFKERLTMSLLIHEEIIYIKNALINTKHHIEVTNNLSQAVYSIAKCKYSFEPSSITVSRKNDEKEDERSDVTNDENKGEKMDKNNLYKLDIRNCTYKDIYERYTLYESQKVSNKKLYVQCTKLTSNKNDENTNNNTNNEKNDEKENRKLSLNKETNNPHEYDNNEKNDIYPHIGILRNMKAIHIIKTLKKEKIITSLYNIYNKYKSKLVYIVRKDFEYACLNRDKDIHRSDQNNIDNKNIDIIKCAKLFRHLSITNDMGNRYIQYSKYRINQSSSKLFKQLHIEPYYHILAQIFQLITDLFQDQTSIEDEFGPTNYLLFCRGLQEEADIQAIRLLDVFVENRLSSFINNNNLRDNIDLRELDTVLDETAFLSRMCATFEDSIRKNTTKIVHKSRKVLQPLLSPTPSNIYSDTHGLLILSALGKRSQEMLSIYVTLEHTLMKKSVAMALWYKDEICWEDSLTSTSVEDVFFIFNKSITRAISSRGIFASCAVANNLIEIITLELFTGFEEQAKSAKKIYQTSLDNLESYDPKTSIATYTEKPIDTLDAGASYSWIHCVNNVQACTDYITRFKENCFLEFDSQYERETDEPETIKLSREKFGHTLQNLDSIVTEFDSFHTSLCRTTLNMLKYHLSPQLIVFDDLNYDITEEEYADHQVNDTFVSDFLRALEMVTKHLKDFYNDKSVNICLQFLTEKVCKRMEMSIMQKSKFSLPGAAKFDLEIRAILSFVTEVSSQSTRSPFGRLIEIGDLLNVASMDELGDILDVECVWKLTYEEMQQVLLMRRDLNKDEVRKYFKERMSEM